ncbi:MAG: response regulator [Nitrospirae bacterium]|nr:response regulator [Nitrospirota bacterium]
MARHKILIADDNVDIVEILRMGFEALDYDVVVARDGEEVFAKVYLARPELILLDIMMPKINGYEVCRRLKTDAQYRQIPIVMLTAKSQDMDKAWGREVGADAYVTKPFDPEEVEQLVEKLLGGKGARAGEVEFHPLTQLPGYPQVRQALEARKSAGASILGYRLFFDETAYEVFCQKYGSVKGEEVLKIAAGILQDEIGKMGGRVFFLGHLRNQDLVLIGDSAAARTLADRSLRELEKLLPLRYDTHDRLQGYILRRASGGEGERIPLLCLQMEEIREVF